MQTYMISKGDTLWMIAKKFGVSLEALIKANPQIKDPNKIRVGETVRIPLEEIDGRIVYTAQNGDTMWNIARKFGVSTEALLLENPGITDGDALTAGMKIRIPVSGECAETSAVYRVRPGDTYWQIARKHHISLESLLKANPQIGDEAEAREGLVLNIPLAKPSGQRSGMNNGALYFVKSGDTFFRIAQRYALPSDTLKKANPQIADENRLVPGMQLYLPGFHHVKNGETLYSIAMYYGVSPEDLIRVNPQITDTDEICAGDKIAVPRRENGDMAFYTVKPGDTLYRIAQKYNVPVEAILRHNREIVGSDLIYPRQELRIPGPHLLQNGQNLPILAEIYGIPLGRLREANPNLDEEKLRSQEMIMIPDAETDSCRYSPKEDGGGVDYIIQSGDTMSSVADMYHVPLSALIHANPQIPDADRVDPGMVVHVPTGFVECVCHTVKRGETVWKIAAMYGLTAKDLIHANPRLEDADRIVPGQVLMIPIRDIGKRSESAGSEILRAVTYPEIYVAQRGDTLSSVAMRFGTSVKQLRLANEALADDDRITPGQQLIVLPSEEVCEYRCLECPWLEQGIEEE